MVWPLMSELRHGILYIAIYYRPILAIIQESMAETTDQMIESCSAGNCCYVERLRRRR